MLLRRSQMVLYALKLRGQRRWEPLLAEIAGLDQITGNVGEP